MYTYMCVCVSSENHINRSTTIHPPRGARAFIGRTAIEREVSLSFFLCCSHYACVNDPLLFATCARSMASARAFFRFYISDINLAHKYAHMISALCAFVVIFLPLFATPYSPQRRKPTGCGAHAPPTLLAFETIVTIFVKIFPFIDWKWIYDDFFYSLRMCFWVILNIE